MRIVDVVIIGAGTAGMTAYAKLKHHFKDVVIINEGPYGTVCARIGCMPSKVLIQVAEDVHRFNILKSKSLVQDCAIVNKKNVMAYVRKLRDKFVGKILNTVETFGSARIDGKATFIDKNTVEVNKKKIRAKYIIIATGSRPILPKNWQELSKKIITSDEVFELQEMPKSIAVIGLGPIGLELGTTFAKLGVDSYGFDMSNSIAGISDPEVASKAIAVMQESLPIYLGNEVSIEKAGDNLKVITKDKSVEVEYVLASLGRRANIDSIGLDKLGIALNKHGTPTYDKHTLNIANTSIYITGDANSFRPILHEAANDARIVCENIINAKTIKFKRKTPLGITFTAPNIAFVGLKHSQLDLNNTIIVSDDFQMGRVKVIGEEGRMRLYVNKDTGRLIGSELVGPHVESLAHQISLGIENNLTVGDYLKSPFYHPTVEESFKAILRKAAAELGWEHKNEIQKLDE